MNEHIERLVERVVVKVWEKSEAVSPSLWYVNPDQLKEIVRTALTSVYNAGLERAREVAKERLENNEWGGDPTSQWIKHVYEKSMHFVVVAIEKEKIGTQI